MVLYDPYTTAAGDPDQIQRQARDLRSAAANIRMVSQMLSAVSTRGVWESDAGREFATQVGKTPQSLTDMADRLESAAEGIGAFPETLRQAQREMKDDRRLHEMHGNQADMHWAQLQFLAPATPEYVRAEREYTEAVESRDRAARRYEQEGAQVHRAEARVAAALGDISQQASDPKGYDLFEGASDFGKSNVVDNPATTWIPMLRAVKGAQFADPVGQLGRRAFYGEGSYCAAGQGLWTSFVNVVKIPVGKGAKAAEAQRKAARAEEIARAKRRHHSGSQSPIAARGLREGLKIHRRQMTAQVPIRAKHHLRDEISDRSGQRLIDDMSADWAAIAGSGQVAKGAHAIRYSAKSAQHVASTTEALKTTNKKPTTPSKDESCSGTTKKQRIDLGPGSEVMTDPEARSR